MKILLATDGSAFSRRALAQTVSLAAALGAEVRVVLVSQVVFVSRSGSMFPVPDSTMELPSNEEATSILGEAVSALEEHGIPTESRHLVGHAVAETVLAEAESWKADMIVTGSHGRSGVVRFLMGSVSSELVQHAPCTVVVVKAPDLIGDEVPAARFMQTAETE